MYIEEDPFEVGKSFQIMCQFDSGSWKDFQTGGLHRKKHFTSFAHYLLKKWSLRYIMGDLCLSESKMKREQQIKVKLKETRKLKHSLKSSFPRKKRCRKAEAMLNSFWLFIVLPVANCWSWRAKKNWKSFFPFCNNTQGNNFLGAKAGRENLIAAETAMRKQKEENYEDIFRSQQFDAKYWWCENDVQVFLYNCSLRMTCIVQNNLVSCFLVTDFPFLRCKFL